jgi:hypothetical protein
LAVLDAVASAVAGALVAAFTAWLVRREAAIEVFLAKASGATRAREKADAGSGDESMATWLAGELPPLADTLGRRIRRLEEPAGAWAAALDQGNLPQAQRAEATFKRKARFAGFGR